MKRAPLSVCLLLMMASPAQYARASVCVYRPPRVRQIHGIIADSSNAPIPGATVTIIRGKKSLTATTGDSGEFQFNSIEDGEYKLNVSAIGFVPAYYSVLLSHQTNHWKESIRIKLAVGLDTCGGTIEIVKHESESRQAHHAK